MNPTRQPMSGIYFRISGAGLINGSLDKRFELIYAVAVIHMLLLDQDRFYQFTRDHLTVNGIGLICTMGDGDMERCSDINTAFELQERNCKNGIIWVAGTSCCMVSYQTFETELGRNHLEILEMGRTEIPFEFPQMMYAVIQKQA